MGSFSIWHWLVVLLIVVLVFGTKKLRNVGEDLGGAVKGFKKGMDEAESEHKAQRESLETEARTDEARTVDVDAKEKQHQQP